MKHQATYLKLTGPCKLTPGLITNKCFVDFILLYVHLLINKVKENIKSLVQLNKKRKKMLKTQCLVI